MRKENKANEEVEAVEPVQMNIYQNNIYIKRLKLAIFRRRDKSSREAAIKGPTDLHIPFLQLLLLLSIYLPLTKKVLHSFRQKKLIEVNQKWKNHVSIQKRKYHFFIYIDILLKSDNYQAGNLNKTYSVNICFT